MSTFLDALGDRIVEKNLGVLGVSLFIGSLPANKKNGILIRAPIAGVKIDPDLPGYRRGNFQVIVRGELHQEAEALSLLALNELHGNQFMMGRFYVRFLTPETDPINYPRGDSGLIEFSITFNACYSDPDATL